MKTEKAYVVSESKKAKKKKNLQFGAMVIEFFETSIFLKSSPIVFLFQVEIKIKENGDMMVVHDKITAIDVVSKQFFGQNNNRNYYLLETNRKLISNLTSIT